MSSRGIASTLVTGNIMAICSTVACAATNTPSAGTSIGNAVAAPVQVAGSASPPAVEVQPASESGDIVVTANKRKESLDRVPISVIALSGQAAATKGITDMTSLQQAVPGLQFPKAFDGATPTIRGIGTSFGIGAVESVVATYVDDVYIAQPGATLFDFNNISQIEVLKGPQGTIYGRNAMGGVIDVHTPDPSHRSSGNISLGYGNYSTFSGQGYFTTGISENLAADVAVTGSNQADGWGKNLYDGKDAFKGKSIAVRSKWLFTPDAETSITGIFDYSSSTHNDGVAMRPVDGSLFLNGQAYQGFYNVNENQLGVVTSKQIGGSLKAQRDIGVVKLISITAYRHAYAHISADEDQSVANAQQFLYDDGGKTWSQELRAIADPTRDLHLIGGLFYFSNDASLSPLRVTGSAVAPLAAVVEGFKQQTKSYAVFGQMVYDLPADFHLTLGGRYTWDRVHFTSFEDIYPTADARVNVAAGDSRINDRAPNFKINLQKDLGSSTTIYGGYSTGFKGATYNSTSVLPQPVTPEYLHSWAAGMKGSYFDRALRVHLEGFYYTYMDLQLNTIVQSENITATILQNAASARNYGIDADFEFRPAAGLSLTGGFEYEHARFTKFPEATFSVPLTGGGNATATGNAAGLRLPHAADFSANGGFTYQQEVAFGSLTLGVNVSYTSRFAWDVDNRLTQRPYAVGNASLLWTAKDTAWGVRLWVKNMTGTRYSIYTTANVVGDEESPAAPRTFGFTVTRRFGS